ncbi:MAG: hypothetical protein F6K16_32955, partial [Symploca sp. SIO2B6]|nr:hypothetical protein [Symploca sp. SIO2B6]
RLDMISQAHQLAIATDTDWIPSLHHIFQLGEAISAVQTIPADSRWYPHAQTQLIHWEAQLADIQQLHLAQASARLGLPATVKWAAHQAAQLPNDRPRRIQAQTLAAHWTKEIQRVHDRNHLEWANRLAQPGTRASLKMAIVEAQKVERDRPLYGEAQQLVNDWTQQIEVYEDEPYWTLAQSLARQGKFQEAIETAAVIRPGRSLYASVQTTIARWQQEIQQPPRPAGINSSVMTPASTPLSVQPAITQSLQALPTNSASPTITPLQPQPLIPEQSWGEHLHFYPDSMPTPVTISSQ